MLPQPDQLLCEEDRVHAVKPFVVQRQFPLRSALWALAFVVLTAILATLEAAIFADWRAAGYYVNYADPSATILSLIFVGVFLAAFLIGFVVYVRPVVAYVFDPSPFVIDAEAVHLGNRCIAYRDIVGLRQDARKAVTVVEGGDGTVLRLHWSIWADAERWNDELGRHKVPALRDVFERRLAAGERVTFGKVLALDRDMLYFKSKATPLRSVLSLHYQQMEEDEVDQRELRIGTVNGIIKVEDRNIENPHVFIALVQSMTEQLQSVR